MQALPLKNILEHVTSLVPDFKRFFLSNIFFKSKSQNKIAVKIVRFSFQMIY